MTHAEFQHKLKTLKRKLNDTLPKSPEEQDLLAQLKVLEAEYAAAQEEPAQEEAAPASRKVSAEEKSPKKSRVWRNIGLLLGVVAVLVVGVGVFRDNIMQIINPTSVIRLRSEPRTVSQDEAQQVFGVIERKFDWGTGWAPQQYIENQFEDWGEVVVDHATRLMWQKSGSDGWLTYKDAQAYVKELNRQKFAGYDDWRLPTIPELMSLLEPERQSNGLYIDPIFDSEQFWCWSADKRLSEGGSASAAWLVLFHYGDVYRYNLDINLCVRAVRSCNVDDLVI